MDLLLLSMNPAAIPSFLDGCVGALERPLRLGYVSDAGIGMPFASAERAKIEAFGYSIIEIRARDMDVEKSDELLDSLDAIYVASGETFALLDALRSSGADQALAERVRAGLPYIGCSAGSIVAGPTVTPLELMDSREAAPDLQDDSGLQLIEQIIVPHADGQLPPYPPALIQQVLTTYGDRYPLLPLRDDQALLVSAEGAEVIDSF